MTLSKVIANLEYKIGKGFFSKETEVELIIISKHHKTIILAEVGKNTMEKLKDLFDK